MFQPLFSVFFIYVSLLQYKHNMKCKHIYSNQQICDTDNVFSLQAVANSGAQQMASRVPFSQHQVQQMVSLIKNTYQHTFFIWAYFNLYHQQTVICSLSLISQQNCSSWKAKNFEMTGNNAELHSHVLVFGYSTILTCWQRDWGHISVRSQTKNCQWSVLEGSPVLYNTLSHDPQMSVILCRHESFMLNINNWIKYG